MNEQLRAIHRENVDVIREGAARFALRHRIGYHLIPSDVYGGDATRESFNTRLAYRLSSKGQKSRIDELVRSKMEAQDFWDRLAEHRATGNRDEALSMKYRNEITRQVIFER